MIRKIGMAAVIIGILFLIYGAVATVLYGTGTPMLWAWYAVGIVLTANGIIALFSQKRSIAIVSLVINIAAAVFLSGGAVFSLLALSEMNSEPERGCEYVIILGAAVDGCTPSEALQKRIDAAYAYLCDNKNSVAVGTGGQGEGEEISEGRCIADELEKMGIDGNRIIFEETSTTTVENFDNALELMENAESIAVVSSGFHVFRAKLLLSCRTDARISVVPSSGADILTPHYMLREYSVFLVDIILGNYRRMY